MPLHTEEEQEKTTAQRILEALQKGEGSLRDIISGTLQPGEVPSGTEFEQASRPRSSEPVQGFFEQIRNFSENRARGKVAQHGAQQKQSAAESLFALQKARGETETAKAEKTRSEIGFKDRKLEVQKASDAATAQNLLDEIQVEKQKIEFELTKLHTNDERQRLEAGLKFLIDQEANAINKVEALTKQELAAQSRDLLPSEIQENLGGAAQGFGAGAASQARAGSEQQRADSGTTAAGAQATQAEASIINANSLKAAREALAQGNASGAQIEMLKAVGQFIKDTGAEDPGFFEKLLTTPGPIKSGVRGVTEAGLEAALPGETATPEADPLRADVEAALREAELDIAEVELEGQVVNLPDGRDVIFQGGKWVVQ